MQAHTVERVESWDSRPFSGGFRELHDLADREFSGAVVADDTWLFMLNGRVIGVFEGDVEDFGDASGTVYEAPHPSVALLFSMQERGGETQAKYYTNDTPLSEAADTLKNANFTGYIELSENVLSGDYYVVYYGGRSMSAAFVGASEELITGEEAFERADDEVGVYEVKKSPVNVTELPDAEDNPDSETAGAASASASSDDSELDGSNEESDEHPEPDTATEDADPNPTTVQNTKSAATPEADNESSESTEASTESVTTPDTRVEDDVKSGADSDTPRASGSNAGDPSDVQANEASSAEEEGVFEEEEEWRNARSVPTLAPEKSKSTDGGATRSRSTAKTENTGNEPTKQSRSSTTSADNSGTSQSSKPRSTVEKLKRAVKQRDAKLEDAAERIESLEAERDELRERLETLEAERDDLQARAEDLEAQLADATATGSNEPADLTPEAALSGTNLFVRYDSKGKPTLDDLGPDTDLEAVNKNLRIDHHTQFEASEATVNGEHYESFLEASAAYRFVSWAVRKLPFEIRDAGHTNGLGDLYQALPEVDRAELDGTVAVDTEDGAMSRTFDVVLRDRMGDPLVVAELNAEREPVTGEEMGALVDDATAVREGVDELSAAMYVTSSFFEPAALETASEETGGGGFLSRSDKESFVNVGRKSGYHLCLIEDRNDAFHLTVPEL